MDDQRLLLDLLRLEVLFLLYPAIFDTFSSVKRIYNNQRMVMDDQSIIYSYTDPCYNILPVLHTMDQNR